MSALLAPLVLSMVAGPVGCLIVWRRMAYFGDALAHSALLGVALGLIIGFTPSAGVAVTGALFAVLLVYLQSGKKLAVDTLLGILAHAGLALGLTLLFLTAEKNENGRGPIDPHELLETYLLGSLENISAAQNLVLGVSAVVIAVILKKAWEPLILMTLNMDLARAEGVPTLRLQYVMMGVMAAFVVMGLHVTGVLFITSMIIMPAAAARQISTTPEKMVFWSVVFAVSGVLAGYGVATDRQLPPGPVIVSVLTLVFVLSMLVSVFLRQKRPRI